MSNQILPQGYKNSKVGVIPEEWEVVKLGKALIGKPKYGINAAAVVYSKLLPTYLRITDINESGNFKPNKKVSVRERIEDVKKRY